MNDPQTDRRDRIAAALLARIKRATVSKTQLYDGLTSLLAANEFDLADAVLGVLPPPADRAAVEPLTEADRGEEDGVREWADYMRGWNNCRAEVLAAETQPNPQ